MHFKDSDIIFIGYDCNCSLKKTKRAQAAGFASSESNNLAVILNFCLAVF